MTNAELFEVASSCFDEPHCGLPGEMAVMTVQSDPSVDELRRESERTRAAFTDTVGHLRDKVSDTADDLKERLSPVSIKEEVKDYVRQGGERFFHSIERKARANPLQAVAIGAGLAYPLLGLFRAVPVPIMLVGAGLWLPRQKTARTGGNGYARDMVRKVADAGAEGASRVSDEVAAAATSVSAGAQSLTNKVRAAADDARDSISRTGRSVVDTVRESAMSATDAVSATASDLQSKVSAAASDLQSTVSATASDLQSTVSDFGGRTKNSVVDLMDRNPLLVGGIGLAIGAFVAASLPRSDAENRMFGEHSDDLKDQAMKAASQGAERAKDVAAGMVGDVAAAAARQGLNAEGLARAVEGVTEGVKSVVDKGVKTALGEETPSQSQSPNAVSTQQKLGNGGLDDGRV